LHVSGFGAKLLCELSVEFKPFYQMDTALPDARDLIALARERVQGGPAPTWVKPFPYDAAFEPKIRGPLTYLLIEQQVHAEIRQTFVQTAVRLETMKSVQEQSQWRMIFEPQTQSVVLHSIKIRRGQSETEHLSLDRIKFLQREAGLHGLVIDGWITLLLLLEDVAAGDILEWSYTLTHHPRLLAEFVDCIFALPQGAELGSYHFLIHHHERRVLKWMASSEEFTPTIQPEGQEIQCRWSGEKLSSPAAEPCTPSWQLDFPWIQVSDCPDWQTVARAVQLAWKEDARGEGLAKLIEEIKNFAPDLPARINRAVELAQDGFRYLSVNLELGGQIPAPTEMVIRRRYGDCKDMAFLLVRLLRELGISARPVLVNAVWRRAIANFLPSARVFNHAVVEFEFENEKRWVDATLKFQGGGALKRQVMDFGFGLPVDPESAELVAVPNVSLPAGSFELKESFILDTAGNSSFVAVVVKAQGFYANALRFEFANDGLEAAAKKRLQICANRFSNAKRIGELQYRDERESNEFLLAEVFEISGFLKRDAPDKSCFFLIPSDALGVTLMRPSPAPRRNAFALPFPCHCVHTVEVICSGLKTPTMGPYEANYAFFNFSRRTRGRMGFFTLTFSCTTKVDAVPAEKLPYHRKEVESVWSDNMLRFRLPLGCARVQKPSDFGALPGSAATPPVLEALGGRTTAPGNLAGHPAKEGMTETPEQEWTTATTSPVAFIDPTDATAEAPRPFLPPQPLSTHRRHGFRHKRMNDKCWLSLLMLFGALLALFVGVAFASSPASHTLAGLFFLFAMPMELCSVALAVVGWIECARQPERYWQGKTIAAILIVLSLSFGLAIAPLLVRAFSVAMSRTRARSQMRAGRAELLDFKALGFVFHYPGAPWTQVDTSRLDPHRALALRRDGPISFIVSTTRLSPQDLNPMDGLISSIKATMKRDAFAYHLIKEGNVTRRGIPGWQMEMTASTQGHNNYYIDWVAVTNGFGYMLSAWARTESESQLKADADELFSDFELTEPQR
jgi:hypothetical protein